MTARPIDVPRLHPTARTVAVTSGKGGAAKTTTAVAVATRLTAMGHRAVLVDVDVPAPNAAIVAEVAEPKLKARYKTVEIVLPESPYGFRVATPTAFKSGGTYHDMLALPQWANNVDVIVYDLPGGWTQAQVSVMENFVDIVVAVTPPTPSALSDHAAHLRHLAAMIPTREEAVRKRDKRRKVEFPDAVFLAVETLGYYTGTDPKGKVLTVRRLDAIPADEVEAAVGVEGAIYAGSIPSAPDVKALSETDEIGALAERVMA